MELFLAIDGGASKTEGLLLDEFGNVLARKCVDSTNPNDIGREDCASRLSSLAEALLEGKLALSAFAGISGATGNEESIREALSPFSENVTVGNDAMNLLEIAGENGACLISGTGSVCFVRRNGELRRIGGWGYLLDEYGGGYAMGRDALAAVLMVRDRRLAGTSLVERVCAVLGDSAENSIPKIYAGGKAFIASFAPLVFEEAEKGDAVSKDILEYNAQYLAKLVGSARYFDVGEGFKILASGSLLTKRDELFNLVSEKLPSDVELYRESLPPVYGAYLGALRAVEYPTHSVRECFENTYRKFIT